MVGVRVRVGAPAPRRAPRVWRLALLTRSVQQCHAQRRRPRGPVEQGVRAPSHLTSAQVVLGVRRVGGSQDQETVVWESRNAGQQRAGAAVLGSTSPQRHLDRELRLECADARARRRQARVERRLGGASGHPFQPPFTGDQSTLEAAHVNMYVVRVTSEGLVVESE